MRLRFNDLPMVVKIGLAPALALAALAGGASTGISNLHHQAVTIERIAGKDMVVSLRLAEISKRISGVHGGIYVLLTQQAAQMDPGQAQAQLTALAKETDAVKTDLTKVEGLLPPDERKAFDKVNSDLNDYRGALDVVGSMLAIDFKTAQSFVAPFEAHYQRMTATLDRESGAIQAAAEAEAKASARSAWLVGMFSGIGSLAAFLVASGVAVVMVTGTRSAIERIAAATQSLADGDNDIDLQTLERGDELGAVVRSLGVFRDNQLRLEAMRESQDESQAREAEARGAAERLRAETAAAQEVMVRSLADGLSRLSRGDLTIRLDSPFAAEYEQIRSDFNGAVAQLQETLQQIASTANAIGSGAEEIAEASDELSSRTEKQAASLEESAAALDELTGGVKAAASNARQASDVVAVTRSEATSSGDVVKQAVTAMSRIERSSQQISQIIGVIDEIAFQTNLLALNAGVEAARAGDAGRGFAVVAQEVRALAQRSADAAKEIKSLISTSSGEVGAGVALVDQTGQALERIIVKVAEVDALIAEIASSSNIQAVRIGEVNGAVNQMDRMTQQNAAMVEESTAATQALRGQTAELARMIGAFTLGGAMAASVARGPRPATGTTRPVASPARSRLQAVRAAFAGGSRKGDDWQEF